MKVKMIEIMAVLCLTVGVFMISMETTGAYLMRRTKELRNHLTFGTLHVELTEPAWQEEDAKQLPQKAVVEKNPIVTNTGTEDAWIFLQVSVPVKKIALVDDTSGRKRNKENIPLFSYTPGDMWELVEEKDSETQQVRVYGYRQIVKPKESTQALFEQVALVNYLEGELTEKDNLEMPIQAMAVQDHVTEEGKGLKEIYRVYQGEKG